MYAINVTYVNDSLIEVKYIPLLAACLEAILTACFAVCALRMWHGFLDYDFPKIPLGLDERIESL